MRKPVATFFDKRAGAERELILIAEGGGYFTVQKTEWRGGYKDVSETKPMRLVDLKQAWPEFINYK